MSVYYLWMLQNIIVIVTEFISSFPSPECHVFHSFLQLLLLWNATVLQSNFFFFGVYYYPQAMTNSGERLKRNVSFKIIKNLELIPFWKMFICLWGGDGEMRWQIIKQFTRWGEIWTLNHD